MTRCGPRTPGGAAIAGASLGAVSGQLLIMFGLFLVEGALGYYLFTLAGQVPRDAGESVTSILCKPDAGRLCQLRSLALEGEAG